MIFFNGESKLRRQSYNISQFLCPECNNIIPLPRKTKSEREKGHIKDIYCPWCDKIQKTIEYHENQPIKNLAGEIIEY